jgi:hypothetical protein
MYCGVHVGAPGLLFISGVRGVYSYFELSRFDGPCFPCHGSCPTHSNDKLQRTVKTSSGRMVKCWIFKIFLTNPSMSHQPSLILCR